MVVAVIAVALLLLVGLAVLLLCQRLRRRSPGLGSARMRRAREL